VYQLQRTEHFVKWLVSLRDIRAKLMAQDID
jgi:putative component of toxin-antitoxin plasmid stabilization module